MHAMPYMLYTVYDMIPLGQMQSEIIFQIEAAARLIIKLQNLI